MVGWALLADSIPLYPLYALFFADTGLTEAQISALFVIWTAVGLVAEVPSGALADRFSRRMAIVVSTLFQAAGYLLWVLVPGFGGFAAGFVLWGFGGSLSSGSQEALLYDGLSAAGASGWYPRVQGRVIAASSISQLPAALLATPLFALGGYRLAGWVSIAICLAASLVALRFPEPPRTSEGQELADGEPEGYLATLKAGVREAATHPAVRWALISLAVIGGIDGIDEYIPILAERWGVPVEAIPIAILAIPLATAAGGLLGGRASGLRPWKLALIFGTSIVLLRASGLVAKPVALSGVAAFYFLYYLVLIVLDARLQASIRGPARATVTSVSELGVALVAIAVYGLWAVGDLMLVSIVCLAIAFLLPLWLRDRSATE